MIKKVFCVSCGDDCVCVRVGVLDAKTHEQESIWQCYFCKLVVRILEQIPTLLDLVQKGK